MSVDYTNGVVGRDPIGQTVVEALLAEHPDWSDRQVADRINREYSEPVIDIAEVAYWRTRTEGRS